MNFATTPSSFWTKRWAAPVLCLVLALATLAVFGQAVRYGFICFDDDHYVDHNPALEAGLSPRGLIWAFTTNLTHISETAEYWEPLTLLTRLADYQIYRFEPWGHHLTSVLLHLATGLALFFALRRLTGASTRSALVAALFLFHPMHVEPVLWLSARKDLVNGLFYVVTLWTYGWYAARPNWRRYLAVFSAALAANMGKPMAVSLPFVLLLLDLWPLHRFPSNAPDRLRQGLRLVWEKVPLFILTVGVAGLAVYVQKDIGAMDIEDALPLPWRVGNAALAVARYVVKAFVPVHLAFFYPHPGRDLNVPLAIMAGLAALLVSFVAIGEWRRRPWLTVGWFWFLVVLGPVLGLIQIGDQAMADRYSYVAFIGLFIAAVWQASEWFGAIAPPLRGRLAWALALVTIFAQAVLCFFQVRTWRSSETVFAHALAVEPRNYLAQYNLGTVLWETGRRDQAMVHFKEAVRLRESVLRKLMAEANADAARGDYRQAVPRLMRVLLIMPWNAELHQQLGSWLALDHQSGKALMQFDTALKYRPDWIQPRISIAVVLLTDGQTKKAENVLRDVLAREPRNADAAKLLGQLPPMSAPH
jgi:hypothetical protein